MDGNSPYTNGVTATAANGSGTSYVAGNTFSISSNTTLHAKWLITPYGTWNASYGLTGENALATANPDGDNLINLLEFAFGTDPTSPATGSLAYTVNGNMTRGGTPLRKTLPVRASHWISTRCSPAERTTSRPDWYTPSSSVRT